ncbi:MAG TPA: hypothetical protein VNA29_01845 [Sphingomicrobium sp.]|nr:hypothetical protein [Sphingomicrobium sp.]
MPHSSAPALLLPFGSLTGVIPIDVVPEARVLGDLSIVLGCDGQRMSQLQKQLHSVIAPVPPASRGELHRDEERGNSRV